MRIIASIAPISCSKIAWGDTYRQALSALVFTTTTTIAWRDFLYRQAPRALVFTKLQTPPGAPLLTTRHYTSTCTLLVLVQVQAHFTQVALICSHSRVPLMKSIVIYSVPGLIASHMCTHPLII